MKYTYLLALTLLTGCCVNKSGGGACNGSDALDPNIQGNIPFSSNYGPLKDVNFEYDSSVIDGMATKILTEDSEWLKSNSYKSVAVEGHCDERGTAEYNLALGERRAKAAVEFLKTTGVDSKKLSTITYGEELPIDAGHDESAWRKNRRVHFSVK